MRLAIFADTYLPQVNGVARTLTRISSYLINQDIPFLIFAPDCGIMPQYSKNVPLKAPLWAPDALFSPLSLEGTKICQFIKRRLR